MRAVLFGSYQAATHPRVAVLLEGLQANGIDVTECNEPLGLDTASRVAILQQPWRVPVLVWHILGCWFRLARRARKLERPDVVIVPYLAHFDVHVARLLFRRSLLVLDHLVSASDTARDRGERGGVKLRVLSVLDAAALRVADLAMVDTEQHREFVPDRFRSKAVVVPVGASAVWFDAAPDGPRAEGPLRVVFFGLYTPLQGAPVIARALRSIVDVDLAVTMIGTGQDRAETEAITRGDQRVRWLDWVGIDELPALVAEHDICLGIFDTGPKALRVVPNKAYQGAAAGCVVVTSRTAPQHGAFGDAAVYVAPGDADELGQVLARLAAAPCEVVEHRSAVQAVARARFTAAHVVRPLIDAMSDVVR